MENAQDGIFILSSKGYVIETNLAAENLLGRPRAEIIGQRFDSFFMANSSPTAMLDMRNLIAKDSFRIENISVQQTPEKRAYVDISSSRVQLPGGNLVYCSVHDITERTKLEYELWQAQKMEALGQLTGGMAHDFNNMLALIVGNLDLMEGETSKVGELHRTQSINAVLKCSELIRALLAFARRQPLNPTVIDVNTRLKQLTSILERVLGEPIEIKMQLDEKLWPVRVDAVQLESAVTNLAINARDAMPKGGKLIISTTNVVLDYDYVLQSPEAVPGSYACIDVTDTGVGILPELIGRVFEPFFTTKETGKGSGLGLSMVYGFVKQSGGHVKIDSEVDHGTSIKLYLPCLSGDATKAETKNDVDVDSRGSGETILVVEDNIAVRHMTVQQLRSLGYKAIEASSGHQALDIINSGTKFDMLFSDVVMPGKLSGFDVAREARVKNPDLPILLTSGFPGIISEEFQKIAPGIQVELLSKPYRKLDLARRIHEVLRKRVGKG